MRHIKNSFYAKCISIFLVAFFINGDFNFSAKQVDYQDHFQKALEKYNLNQYSDAINQLEMVLKYVDKTNKSLIGKIHLLMGASYEKLKLIAPAERYYRLVRESKLGVGDLKVIDLNALPLCRKILLGLEIKDIRKPEETPKPRAEEEKVKKNGIYEKPAIKPKKKKFPWLIVIGSVILAGVISFLLLRKKTKESNGDENGASGPISVKITSNWEETAVFIDGNSVGSTPLTTTVSYGEHELKLVKSDIGEAKKRINFERNKNYIISVELSPYKFEFVTKWGSYGIGNGQFYTPGDIAIDSSNSIYVVGTLNYRIQKFTTSGIFLTKWGRYGSRKGEFVEANGIAIDKNNHLYIVDTSNYRIQKFTSNGDFITKWGSAGTGNGQFSLPEGIAIDKNNNVYVSDTNNFRIQKFTSKGKFVTKWGARGSGNGQFEYPYGLAIDKNNYLYVVDSGNDRVQKFTLSGSFVEKWGSTESGNLQSNRAGYVEIDDNGYVFISDGGNNCIQKFTSQGKFVTKWGSTGSGNSQFSCPSGLTIDQSGFIYVVDSCNSRIQKFRQTNTPEGDGEWKTEAQITLKKNIANQKLSTKDYGKLKIDKKISKNKRREN